MPLATRKRAKLAIRCVCQCEQRTLEFTMHRYVIRRRPRASLTGRLAITAFILLVVAAATDRFGLIDLPSVESLLAGAHHWLAADLVQ